MIIAHHLIWTAYGWWLPNDPRGSMSDVIRAEPVAALGSGHYGRRRVQPPSAEIRRFYGEAPFMLKHALLTLDAEDVKVIADSFAETIRRRGYTCHACAVMPDHVHLVVRRHRDHADEMTDEFQRASAVALIGAGRREPAHPVWGGPGWKVFENTRADVERVTEYVRLNPVKIGRPEQRWEFVTPYDGWLPGGHPEARGFAKSQAGRRAR